MASVHNGWCQCAQFMPWIIANVSMRFDIIGSKLHSQVKWVIGRVFALPRCIICYCSNVSINKQSNCLNKSLFSGIRIWLNSIAMHTFVWFIGRIMTLSKVRSKCKIISVTLGIFLIASDLLFYIIMDCVSCKLVMMEITVCNDVMSHWQNFCTFSILLGYCMGVSMPK